MMVWFSAWQKAGSEGWHPIWHTGTKQKQNRTRGGLFFAPFLGILFLTNIGYPFIMVEVTKGKPMSVLGTGNAMQAQTG